MLFQQSFGYFRKVIGRVSAQRNLCLVFATGLYEFKISCIRDIFIFFVSKDRLKKQETRNNGFIILL